MKYTEEQFFSACVTYAHDFGIMSTEQREGVMNVVRPILEHLPEPTPRFQVTADELLDCGFVDSPENGMLLRQLNARLAKRSVMPTTDLNAAVDTVLENVGDENLGVLMRLVEKLSQHRYPATLRRAVDELLDGAESIVSRRIETPAFQNESLTLVEAFQRMGLPLHKFWWLKLTKIIDVDYEPIELQTDRVYDTPDAAKLVSVHLHEQHRLVHDIVETQGFCRDGKVYAFMSMDGLVLNPELDEIKKSLAQKARQKLSTAEFNALRDEIESKLDSEDYDY